ncbi:MAG: ParA family protein [Myxococcota bacterium]
MSSPPSPTPGPVIAVSSNKGGVGKTTLATNLAIYLRALREDLSVLLVSLDDQKTLDRMFAVHDPAPGEPNLKHGWAERSLTSAIQLGEYGVHFVPSPPDLGVLKSRAEDPKTLSRIIANTDWDGVIILDTKSDLEALTVNAYHAADRVLLPVADWASLEEAAKIFRLFERSGLDMRLARVVFTLVDRRTKLEHGEKHLFRKLLEEVQARGWPYYKTHLSRSPRVEMLNSGTGRSLSILHHAKGTAVHDQMRQLTLEVLDDLAMSDRMPELAFDDEPDELWGRAPAQGDGWSPWRLR